MKLTKRLALAALSCITACALALGVGFTANVGTVKADSEGSTDGTVEATSLFTLTKTAASCAVLEHGTYAGVSGVYMGPAYTKGDYQNWSVALSGSFKGDFDMEYAMANFYGAQVSDFVDFTFSDLSGNPIITVGRKMRINGNAGGAEAKYGANAYVYDNANSVYYSIKTDGTKVNSTDNPDDFTASNSAAVCGFYPYQESKYQVSGVDTVQSNPINTGHIVLAWGENDKVAVKLSRLNKIGNADTTVDLYEVATLDGSALKNGYTLKIGLSTLETSKTMWQANANANNIAIESVLITSVNGVSFANENVAVTPNYTDITYSGEVDASGTINLMQGDEATLNFKAIGSAAIGGWSLNEIAKDISKEFTASVAGAQTLTVTEGNYSEDFAINVTPAERGSVDATTLFEIIDAECDDKGTLYGKSIAYATRNGNSGILLGSTGAADYCKWTSAFNGTFSGDLELEYSLIDLTGWGFPIIEFTICDINGNEVFKVGRGICYNNNNTLVNTAGTAYVYDVANSIYYTVLNDGTAINSTANSDKFGSGNITDARGFYPYSDKNSTTSVLGTLAIVRNDDGKIDVKLSRLNTPTDATSGLSLCTVATLDCADKLSGGYKIKVGRRADNTQIWATSVQANTGNLLAGTSVLITSVNGVSFAKQTVKTNKVASTITYSGVTEDDGSIQVALGDNLESFNVSGTEGIGGWNLGDFTDSAQAELFNEKPAGTYQTEVRYGETTKTFNVTVVDSAASLVNGVNLQMKSGASIRLTEGVSGNGIRFRMTVPSADYLNLESEADSDSVTYGMLIMPYDYLSTCGALTVENLFGANAIYGWGDSVADNKVQIIGCEQTELTYVTSDSGNYYYMNISIVDVLDVNLNRKFVAAGYVKCEVNGNVYYKLASYEDNDADNTSRSMYEVATTALASGDLTETQEATVKANYIDVVTATDYTYYTINYCVVGESTPRLSVQINAKVGENVLVPYVKVGGSTVPALSLSGCVFDAVNSANKLYGTVESDGGLTLTVYFTADAE